MVSPEGVARQVTCDVNAPPAVELDPNSRGRLPHMLAHLDHSSRAKLREAPNTRDARPSVPEYHASFASPQCCPSEASFLRDDQRPAL